MKAPAKKKELPVIAVLNDRVRVVAADIQWIIQSRSGADKGWRDSKFCRKRDGLIFNLKEVMRHDATSFDPDIVAMIAAREKAAEDACADLPAMFPEE